MFSIKFRKLTWNNYKYTQYLTINFETKKKILTHVEAKIRRECMQCQSRTTQVETEIRLFQATLYFNYQFTLKRRNDNSNFYNKPLPRNQSSYTWSSCKKGHEFFALRPHIYLKSKNSREFTARYFSLRKAKFRITLKINYDSRLYLRNLERKLFSVSYRHTCPFQA